MGRDDAAHVIAVCVGDRERLALDLADRDHADFAVIVPIVDEGDDPPLEHPCRVGEVEPALAEVLVASGGVEGEVDEELHTLLAY